MTLLLTLDDGSVQRKLADAVEFARAAVLEEAPAEQLGTHVGVTREDAVTASHLFEAQVPGYGGWRWSVTVALAGDEEPVTVSEVVLVPGPDALIAPPWVPWERRVRAGDLGVGDIFPTDENDPRLAPAYLQSDDPAVEEVAREAGLGRVHVLSRFGRTEAATRWHSGEFGPRSDMARSAPDVCGTCGFFVQLAGSLSGVFGVCSNDIAPADGHVVDVEYGCGAHSEVEVEVTSSVPVAELVYDDSLLDFTPAESEASVEAQPTAAETVAAEAQPETAAEPEASAVAEPEAAVVETAAAEPEPVAAETAAVEPEAAVAEPVAAVETAAAPETAVDVETAAAEPETAVAEADVSPAEVEPEMAAAEPVAAEPTQAEVTDVAEATGAVVEPEVSAAEMESAEPTQAEVTHAAEATGAVAEPEVSAAEPTVAEPTQAEVTDAAVAEGEDAVAETAAPVEAESPSAEAAVEPLAVESAEPVESDVPEPAEAEPTQAEVTDAVAEPAVEPREAQAEVVAEPVSVEEQPTDVAPESQVAESVAEAEPVDEVDLPEAALLDEVVTAEPEPAQGDVNGADQRDDAGR
ncbi:hypothetical protein H4696_007688 [Amycolatopsis lexingtonensis]|uniref:DUF3027 domain-containing protein n=1 Tax=Amycolatopsis lexingtonensis TaxID=218822 RepID=A0ABR9IBN9_9PSEU|nr:DUF3027 domain-containing protein [Amycolatopsis lexingtonensis]MBE1500588.1 hypothetical protein [Amycolatopsis lexingtonensis]